MHASPASVLQRADFRLLLMARMCGMMALQAQAVIVGWQVYSLTKDPFMLGLTGLAEAVPAIACALFAGHIVDISRPHRVYVACIFVLALNHLALLLLAGGIVNPPGGNLLPWLFGCIVLSGFARSFIMPSSFALLSQAVPRGLIPSASAWLSSAFQCAAIGGPAVAGIIYGGYGPKAAWCIPLGLMVIALAVLLGMSGKNRSYRGARRNETAAQSIRAGWHFILKHPVLLSVMALDMFAVLFGGAMAMLPAYADQILHVGPEALGMLRASPAIGAIVVAVWLAIRPFRVIRATTLLWVVAGFGVCSIGFGLSATLWLSMAFLALGGAFDSVSMVMRSTLMQWLTPDAMRGRVSSVNSMFIISSNELGAFESGLAARVLGLVPSVVFGGACTLAVVGITAIVSPQFRRTVIHSGESSAS